MQTQVIQQQYTTTLCCMVRPDISITALQKLQIPVTFCEDPSSRGCDYTQNKAGMFNFTVQCYHVHSAISAS